MWFSPLVRQRVSSTSDGDRWRCSERDCNRVGARTLLAWGVLLAAGGCTCTDQVDGLRFACSSSDDCAADHSCRAGECRPNDLPPEQCFPGEDPRPCEIDGCAQICGDDSVFRDCTP